MGKRTENNSRKKTIIYKYATEDERKVLKENFDIDCFEIQVQKIERIFVDKLFASEFYYERKQYIDFAKHIYDKELKQFNSKKTNNPI